MSAIDGKDDFTPVYTIGTVARLCGLPVYTIRWVEHNGLLRAARSEGRQRMFSESDRMLLLEIAALLHRQVNIQGIRVVLELKGYMKTASGAKRARGKI
jgi:DNA-binding transcriptional MerR regulator